jgi:Tol biopolymer transport system component
MAGRLRLRVSGTVPVVLCLLVALIGFAAQADAKSSKDLRLAFINGFSEPQEVFTVGVGHGHGGNGSEPPEQITHVGVVLQLRWSPAGNLFAVQTLPFGTIVVMEPDGSNPHTVATDAILGEFSPDGRRLALTRDTGGNDDIWVVDLHTNRLTPVVTFAVEGFTSHLEWSPDGKWLAFDRIDCPNGTGCGDPQLFVVGVSGAVRHAVALGTDPSWSPDGEQLAFSGLLGEVRVVSATGGEARTIATRTLGAPTALAWQPKGKAIAFFTGDQNPLEGTFSIATVRPDGKQLRTLPLRGFSAVDLSWSPRGEDLAFGASYETPDGFAFDVFSVSEHLDGLRNLTNTGTAFGAEWAPPPPK